ncbi:MAG: aminoacyl-tRNA hydrolase [Bacteroidetes bacterium]|uniref:Peptidyl-tRNA hydrolase n=1 Tax=Phaeocystidibacter marisrubri TaxID=1577780 RepID=A0A6L3ZEQ8_9FLAO|nr:aminoacyl-tRNA hydrolase [Phaeocystidibacter marisrubri]KAB2816170.1 aminoacyl-tRNA hydrolase [Phaeocystidibacter marisrubri]TNE26315.1 MAG: aminoacyl-tRNA hydrolase [Bacteroidota bacterium]GGH67675.1 peptidyl-tRNA hydrolase [Phaeocystidibacter marisrubri]
MKKFLIFGLGNPGAEYNRTRHNIGFEVLDALASDTSSFSSERYADVARVRVKGRELILVKPNTYMNLSGKAVRYWMETEKVPLENILVVVDELALPLGAIRMKLKGSDGGHNGLKSIQQLLGRSDYPRLRFGIGNEFSKGQQVDFVLGKWTEEEWKNLQPRIKKATEAIQSFALAGPQITMNQFNG